MGKCRISSAFRFLYRSRSPSYPLVGFLKRYTHRSILTTEVHIDRIVQPTMDAVYFQYHIVPPQLRKDDEALIRAENISSNSEFKNLRQEWSAELVKMFQPDPESKLQVRPWEILLKSDGSVENRAIARDVDDDLEKGYDNARFRIPSNTIQELGREEKVRRTERFALGSLLYEILSNKNIFPDLSDDTIQDRFNRGDFPEEVYSLPMGPYILGCWSREFEQELERQRTSSHPTILTVSNSHSVSPE